MRLCSYYTLDDPSRYDPDYYESIKDDDPMMFLRDLSYDGERFTTVSYEEGQRYEESYSLLRQREETVQSTGVKIVRYMITDDAETPWKRFTPSSTAPPFRRRAESPSPPCTRSSFRRKVRSCLKHVKTPKRRIFFRYSTLNFLAGRQPAFENLP